MFATAAFQLLVRLMQSFRGDLFIQKVRLCLNSPKGSSLWVSSEKLRCEIFIGNGTPPVSYQWSGFMKVKYVKAQIREMPELHKFEYPAIDRSVRILTFLISPHNRIFLQITLARIIGRICRNEKCKRKLAGNLIQLPGPDAERWCSTVVVYTACGSKNHAASLG